MAIGRYTHSQRSVERPVVVKSGTKLVSSPGAHMASSATGKPSKGRLTDPGLTILGDGVGVHVRADEASDLACADGGNSRLSTLNSQLSTGRVGGSLRRD
jgi:hypothetical protein